MQEIQDKCSDSKAINRNIITEAVVSGSGPLISSPAAMLEDVIRLFLIDGALSNAERKELDRRAERLGVGKIQAEAIEEKIRIELGLPAARSIKEFSQIAEAFLDVSKDANLTPEQLEYLDGKATEFKISQSEKKSIIRTCKDRIRYLKMNRI